MENKIKSYYKNYLSDFRDKNFFYDIVIRKINEMIQNGATNISVFIGRRLYYDKLFDILENEFREMDIILHKEREYYNFYVNNCEQLKKINDFYIKLGKEKPMSEEEFIKNRHYLFK